MMPAIVRNYIVTSLSGTPDVAERLLKDIHSDDPRWDIRPDPERFTLREIVAHLADWEPIHLERLQRIRAEENPLLPDVDEAVLAAENDYAHSDPHGSLEWLRGGREKLVKELESLIPEEWTLPGQRERVGPVTVEVLAVFVAAHDGYHLRQIAQWIAIAEAPQPGA